MEKMTMTGRKSAMPYIADKELFRAVKSAQYQIQEFGIKRLKAVRNASRKFGVSAVDVNHYVLSAAHRARRARS